MINERSITVIVAAHKKYQIPSDDMYLPVHVGSAGKNIIVGYQRDDEGDNISELNPYFCELTGLYWAWKNIKSDYIGMVHYRRHFSLHPNKKQKWNFLLKENEIKKDLGKIKVFVPSKRRYYIESLYSHYAHTHYASQLDETRKIIEEVYPNYLSSYDKVIKQRWGYMFNMMIMQQDLFNDYCNWLFKILFILKDRIGEESLKQLDKFQGRFYGRVSEILFNVWLNAKRKEEIIGKSEIKEIPVLHMEKINWLKKGSYFLKAKFIGKKYNGSF